MRFSSHVLLQYLIQKHGVDLFRIQKEMEHYYSQPQFVLKTTSKGKVTQVSLAEGQSRPPVKKVRPPKSGKPRFDPKPRRAGAEAKQPIKVVLKKRRMINTNTDGNC